SIVRRESFPDVSETISACGLRLHRGSGRGFVLEARPIIRYRDDHFAPIFLTCDEFCRDGDQAGITHRGDAVLDRVLGKGLNSHSGYSYFGGASLHFDADTESFPEPNLLDPEIGAHELDLIRHRDPFPIRLPNRIAKYLSQLLNGTLCQMRLPWDQGG